jgi:hypothetical protein
LIKFEGNKLRYLGPNERSQALLLLKAINQAKNSNSDKWNSWEGSTPGIYVRRFYDILSFMDFYTPKIKGNIYFIIDYEQAVEEKVENFNLNSRNLTIKENDFFIIPNYNISKENSHILRKFKEMDNLKLLSLLDIHGVENKILYINFLKDQQDIL